MIRILEDRVVNQIAAGEVVERPASVVKELVENALDAGAKVIRVDLRAGGADLIRVRDDGVGMNPGDAAMSLERHATSKIRETEDLVGVRSLGFRGEAIPSIAAVSRFEILTRPATAEAGTRVRVEGGRLEKIEAAGAPVGTRVTVRDLFFNLPARRKFLRTTQTELGHCTETVLRQLLNHPGVDVEVNHEGRRLIRAPVHDSMNARAAALLGATGRQLVPLESEANGVRVTGLVSPIGVHRGTARGGSYLYVNGRYVQDSLLRRAISEAYRGLVPRGRYPVVVLRFEVPGEDVDVNVHPAKTEVRFRDARQLAHGLTAQIRSCLGGDQAVAPAQLLTPAAPAAQGSLGLSGSARYPEKPQPPAHVQPPEVPAPARSLARPVAHREHSRAPEGVRGEPMAYLGALDEDTLVCRVDASLWLIDRRRLEWLRAHSILSMGRPEDSLPLLLPAVSEVSSADHQRLMSMAPDLARCGVVLEDFGHSSVVFKRLPSMLDPGQLTAILEAVLAPRRGAAGSQAQDILDALATVAAQSMEGPVSRFETGEHLRQVFDQDPTSFERIGYRIEDQEIAMRMRPFRQGDV